MKLNVYTVIANRMPHKSVYATCPVIAARKISRFCDTGDIISVFDKDGQQSNFEVLEANRMTVKQF